ncbi:MAG TPA: LysR family transcriptional regulator [Polyangiaceae bacterium]|nr:LysR family transcriptional regulator [Polyangiaceae bacterium]
MARKRAHPPRREAEADETSDGGAQTAGNWRLQPPAIFSYLDAVAHHGSIRKAADALHIASSALNRRVLDLEAEVGSPLFERLPRGVRATAAGELLLAYVRRSLKELRLVEAQIDGLRGLVHGRVRIAVAESVTGRMLPDAIAEYHGRHPGVGFSVRVGGPKEIAAALLRDRADLVLTHEQANRPEFEVLAEAHQPLCVLVAPEHPLAARTALRLRDCVSFPIAMPDETLAARTLIEHALGRTSIRFEPALTSNSIDATKVFARSSHGLCFSFQIGKKPDVSGMISIPLADAEVQDATLRLASRRGRVLPVAAASFAEQLIAIFDEL